MTTRQAILLGIGLLILGAFAIGHRRSSALGTNWYSDFEKASAESKKTGRLMMVDFNATWCEPCQQYKKDVFPSEEFKQATKDMILVDIDIDDNPELAQRYRVDGIPDIRIISPSGKQVGGMVGYDGSDGLLNQIEQAKRAAL